jgi:hypothetical protein
VLLGDVFVKMPQREIGIDIAFEPAEQLDGAGLDAPAPRPAAALVHHRRHAPAFDLASQPSHMPGTDSQNLARLHPAQLLGDRFGDHFSPGHGSRLSPYLPLDVVHRAALARLADMFKCL